MGEMPRATHHGSWYINGDENLKVECYVMDNGERVLSLRGSARAMGLSGNGSQALVRNLKTQWIAPFLSDPLKDWLEKATRNELPQYIGHRGHTFLPFEASLFVDLCTAYVDAMHVGALQTESQKETAERLYRIMTAFAKTGLVAVIDEVTGYQEERDRDALQKILAAYISPELLPWTKRFPDEFFKQIFRLKGWEYKGRAKPLLVGKIINHYIYGYLPDGVLDELKSKTPKSEAGNRTNRYHQYLTPETGVPALNGLLQQSMALFKASDTWEEFDRLFKKAMGDPIQIELDLNGNKSQG